MDNPYYMKGSLLTPSNRVCPYNKQEPDCEASVLVEGLQTQKEETSQEYTAMYMRQIEALLYPCLGPSLPVLRSM